MTSQDLVDVCSQYAEVTVPDAEHLTFSDLLAVKRAQDHLKVARRFIASRLSGLEEVDPLPLPDRDVDPRARQLRDGSWVVASRSHPGVFYRVAGFECTCPAGRNGQRCWHGSLVRELSRNEPRPAAPTNKAWFE